MFPLRLECFSLLLSLKNADNYFKVDISSGFVHIMRIDNKFHFIYDSNNSVFAPCI